MTPKLIGKRKKRYEVIKTDCGLTFQYARGPLREEVGDTVYLARRLNSPKSEGQVFEIYPVILEEAKWSKIHRLKNPKSKPVPCLHFSKGSRFIVEKV